MYVNCQLPNGDVVLVDSSTGCHDIGGIPGGDSGVDPPGACFVRNVFTRTLGGQILDIGSADGIHAELVNKLDIPPSSKKKKAAERKAVLPLTPDRRKSLAGRITKSILNLATTYQTTLDFRDQLLLTTPRGRQLKAYYDNYLNEIYVVANSAGRVGQRLGHAHVCLRLAVHQRKPASRQRLDARLLRLRRSRKRTIPCEHGCVCNRLV